MSYAFEDEFNGPAGSSPDPSKWVWETGRWTNNGELETYTNSRTNSYLDGQGNLVIKALRSGRSGFTSARMTTQGKFSRNHGNFEARIKFDLAPGTWPCWWMIGDDYGSVGWPQCGEIDMVELFSSGKKPASTVHSADACGNDVYDTKNIPGGVDTNWHIWHLRWDGNRGSLQFSKDGTAYLTANPGDLPNWAYGTPGQPGGAMFMILNLAVGGDGGGTVPASFTGSTMLVDYVRVWLTRETPRAAGADRTITLMTCWPTEVLNFVPHRTIVSVSGTEFRAASKDC